MSADANKLRIAIAGGSEAQQEAVRSALADLTEVRFKFADASQPSPGEAERETPEVVMFLFGDDRESWPEQCRSLRESAHRPLILALIPNLSPEGMRSAVRAGADEVLGLPLERAALALILVKLSERSRVAQSTGSGARTTTMLSLSGGVGVSTLAASLALGLVRRTGKKVAAVDLDFQQGALAILLDAEAEHSIADLVDPTVTIDSIRLESVMWKHESGLYLLAAPKRLEHAEMISAGTVGMAMDVMKQMFDYVVVDGGHPITEASITAWEHSQRIFYPIEQSVISVRGAQRFLDLWSRLKLAGPELDFLVNRFDPASAFDLNEVQAAIKHPVLMTIGRDEAGFARAQLAAKSIWEVQPAAETSSALDRLVDIVCGAPAQKAASDGFLSRVRSLMHLGEG